MNRIPDKYKITFHLTSYMDSLEIEATTQRGVAQAETDFFQPSLSSRLANHDLTQIPLPTLYAIGRGLYQQLMTGDVGRLATDVLQDAARSKSMVQFNLHFEAKPNQFVLTKYPWEMIADGLGRFLVRDEVVDVIRYLSYPQPTLRFEPDSDESQLLRIVSQPRDLSPINASELDLEDLHILSPPSFSTLTQRILMERISIWGMQFDGHSALVIQCHHCFHLNYHQANSCRKCGASLKNAPQIGAIAFEDEGQAKWIPASNLAEMLYNVEAQLAFVTPPETQLMGDMIIFNSVAPSLIAGGVPAVIGMQYPVSDEFVSQFATSFYQALLLKNDVPIAMRIARKENARKGWYSPVLYLRHFKEGKVDDTVRSAYPTRSIDTTLPSKASNRHAFLVRLWMRKSTTSAINRGQLRQVLDLPESAIIKPLQVEMDDLVSIEGRNLRRGEIEVRIQASGTTITPNKMKIFVDENLEAPCAIFTIKAKQLGMLPIQFSVWQDRENIATIRHRIEIIGQQTPPKIAIETKSLVISVRDIVKELALMDAMGPPCPHCGGTVMPNALFCNHCGKPILADEQLRPRPIPMGTLTPDFFLANRYMIVQEIESDNGAVIYEATDNRLNQRCILKEITIAALSNTAEWDLAYANFNRESRILSSLSHPNLRRLGDYFSLGGRHYMVFNHIEGITLSERIDSVGQPMPEGLVRVIAGQLCNLLEYLHNYPIVSIDIQPNNLMLNQNGEVILLDLSALPTRHSPDESYFVAPEVYGSRTDSRSAIFSLGMTLYTLLTTKKPPSIHDLRDFDPQSDLQKYVSPEMSWIILKALAINPVDRWQSAGEMAWALQGSEIDDRLMELMRQATPPPQNRGNPQRVVSSSSQDITPPPISQNIPSEPKEKPSTLRYLWIPVILMAIGMICISSMFIGYNVFFEQDGSMIPIIAVSTDMPNPMPTFSPTLAESTMPVVTFDMNTAEISGDNSTETPIIKTPTPTISPMLLPSPTETLPPEPTFTPTPVPIIGVVSTGGNRLNVRSHPNTDGDLVGRLENETEIVILNRTYNGEWLEIQDNTGQQGWVFTPLIMLSINVDGVPVAESLPPEPVTGIVNVEGNSLNVRNGAGTDFNIISRLTNGSNVTILRRNLSGDWYEVRLIDGRIGWLASEFIEVTGDIENIEVATVDM
ncbi:MAG: hypothetical protein B6242_01605 [Anaerolineaceae bacterium 4572_78]|nr:MAG: hypothetical protein B6242_01605 [Anaerolineaceae bacterium 4572_78]